MILTLEVCHAFRWGKTILHHEFLVQERIDDWIIFRQYMSDSNSALCKYNIKTNRCYKKFGPFWIPLFYWSSVIISYKIA